jgi:chromosome partitioning protein
MLDWFKRIGAPREQSIEQVDEAVLSEAKVERLVGRFAAHHSAHEEPPPVVAAARAVPAPVPVPETRTPVDPRVFADTRVIVVASQKGGSGKTTVAAHLAVRAGMVGQGPAVLVDTDPQGSLTEWWQARNDENLALATVKLDGLAAHLADLRSRGAAVAIIDTPPALTASIEQVIAIADLVLVPARPSPHDLRAVGATVDMIRRAGKPFLFVVNGAAPRANITAEAVAALSEHGQVAPVILYQRTDYAASMIDGRTVMEAAPASRSAQEIADLWSYVYSRISLRAAA